MNKTDFADRTTKPTAKKYLEQPLDKIIDRLNKNPCDAESEFPFIQSVIAVRAALLTEHRAKRLNWFTSIVAVATVALIFVPFLAPSAENARTYVLIADQQATLDKNSSEINRLKLLVARLTNRERRLDSLHQILISKTK
jgi:hypothetical protein